MSEYLTRNRWLLILAVSIAISSCVNNQQVTYLQDYELSPYGDEYVPPEDYLIQPNDNLYVRIATPDPSLSAIFNSMDERGMMRADEASAHLISYPVELDGTIDIPYLGHVEVAGLTLPQAKAAIELSLIHI